MAKNNKKDIKSLAKMAKTRLKSGFWEDYKTTVATNVTAAENEGIACSNVINYYKARVVERVLGTEIVSSEFYKKVEYILDTYGDVSDILGRLCDENYMKNLSFQQKQRYLFELAANYRECRARYEEEKRFSALKSVGDTSDISDTAKQITEVG